MTAPGVIVCGEWGELVCSCGNTSGADGFDFCLPDGRRVEPLAGGDWAGGYLCNRCGARWDDPEVMPGSGWLVGGGAAG